MRKLCPLLSLFAAATVQAAVFNINTGQTPGVVGTFSDPVWGIVASPTGIGMNTSGPAYILHNSYPRGDGLNQLWQTAGLPASSVANYISSGDCGRDGYTAACPVGDYSFGISLSGPGTLSFSVAGDNRVEVWLAGAFLFGQGASSGSSGWASMSAVQNVSVLTGGPSLLELRVINAGGYTGGILVGTFAEAPEPASFGLAGIALAGLALWRRKRA